jgi:transposase
MNVKEVTLLHARITLSKNTIRALLNVERQARKDGTLQTVQRVRAIFAVVDGHMYRVIASILDVCEQSICNWVKLFLTKGPKGLIAKKPGGRRSKLTKKQKRKLKKMVIDGPQKCGFPGACWRSPMIQDLIHRKFGVSYSVHYIAQLLKNLGFSFQKGKFVSDHLNPEKRKEWLKETWPRLFELAKQKNAHILFGDEASFPQWGSLSHTWAPRGQRPVQQTCGIRKGYKVYGLIDYFTGRFFFKGHEGRLNSESYTAFLKEVLRKTRKHIILIQDGAPYHTSKATKRFFEKRSKRLTVEQLPSYSPDYNPIEKLWRKIKEKEIHMHYFPTFEDLKTKVEEALLNFEDAKKEVLPLFGFYKNFAIE